VDFGIELRELFEEFSQKIRSASMTNVPGDGIRVTRAAFLRACEDIGFPPPRPGYPIDMAKVRKLKRKQVVQYHPDRHRGDERLRPLLERVIRASEVIAAYSEQTARLNEGDRHVEGRTIGEGDGQ
jgi:hypothetical protein